MSARSSLMFPALVAAGVAGYVTIAGLTGFCPACSAITSSVFGSAGKAETVALTSPGAQPEAKAEQPEFQQVNRPGSVNIDKTFDLSNLAIPREQIHTLLPVDAIPALTDPKTVPATEAEFLQPDSRIIVLEVGGEVLGVPLAVLNFHEIVNATVGGEPVAATYCPLCDSATAFKRTIGEGDARTVLEFGVSGALYNSNVIMYDRTDKGLWSQLALQAVSGPRAGTALDFLPVQIVTLEEFLSAHPDAPVVSQDTGHERDYTQSPYDWFFEDPDRLLVPVVGVGDELPRKTLGLGILAGEEAIFVPMESLQQEQEIQTPMGVVRASASDAGINVIEAPKGVRTAQAFYYSWSAFHPRTSVVRP